MHYGLYPRYTMCFKTKDIKEDLKKVANDWLTKCKSPPGTLKLKAYLKLCLIGGSKKSRLNFKTED